MLSRAQGTIEYLVVIAIVVVIALVVVGLLISQTGSAQNVSSTASNIKNKVGVNGISLIESIASFDGNGVLVLKNMDAGTILISKIIVDGVDHTYSESIVMGSEKSFKIEGIATCEGIRKSYSIEINYVNVNGLNKNSDFETVTIDCTAVITPMINFVEETTGANQTWWLDNDLDGYSSSTSVDDILRPVGNYFLSSELTGYPNIDCNDSNSNYTITCPACLVNSDCGVGETCIIGLSPINNFCSTGVIQYLKFDENTGVSAFDSSTNSNTATLSGANWDSTGRINTSVNFDAVTENVALAAGSLKDLNRGSISFWVYPKASMASKHLFSYWVGSSDGAYMTLYSSADSNLVLNMGGDAVQNAVDHYAVYAAQKGLTLNSWNHLVVVWDKNEARIYFNSAPHGSGYSYTNGFRTKSSLTGNVLLGKSYESTSYSFVGEIDEFIAFNRVLSENEISQLYLAEGGDASCAQITCGDYCMGNTRYYSGACSNGDCSYSSEVCPTLCANGKCFTTPVGAWSAYTSQKTISNFATSATMIASFVGPGMYGTNCVTQCSTVPGAAFAYTYTNPNSYWCDCFASDAVMGTQSNWYDLFVQQRS